MMNTYYVAIDGDDSRAGDKGAPFASLEQARNALRNSGETGGDIVLGPGTHYLNEPLELCGRDSGSSGKPVRFMAETPGTATIAGGQRLACTWTPYRDGIYKTPVPAGTDFDQLFINGKRQTRARYPNPGERTPFQLMREDRLRPEKSYSDKDYVEQTGFIRAAGKIEDEIANPAPIPNEDIRFSSDAPRGIYFNESTFSKKAWARPEQAVIHIYQAHYWGNLQWQVNSIDAENKRIWFGHGGIQMGAKWSHNPCEVNKGSYYYIENIFEELDIPGEWYLDTDSSELYYYPDAETDLDSAIVEVPTTQQLIRLVGTQRNPVEHIHFIGIRFSITSATYFEEYSVPSLSDWAIHRGGSIFMQGAHNCVIQSCFFDAVGGNAVFMNNHNRGNTVTGCTFTETGDSAVCLVGSLETTVGTQKNFPYECSVSDNLMHTCGAYGKQVAGVYISRAKRITVSHNEIHRMPRAGICIGDGTWGGHIIEYNYIHDTCRETGDHGPFNSWGRDKYWCLVQSHTEYTKDRNHFAGHVKVDAMEPVIMRHNFFRETAGWGLDLDDGASNYEIYNNLCVGVSMKLREGAYRTIYNNIWVNGANSPCFHVGNEDNQDRYFRNITVMSAAAMNAENDLNFEMGATFGEIYTLIAPPSRSPWLEECDYNCFYSDIGEFIARATTRADTPDWKAVDDTARKYNLEQWRELGFDKNSIFADPLFVDPEHDNYQVRPESPALKIGFENFDMDSFGVTGEYPDIWPGETGGR